MLLRQTQRNFTEVREILKMHLDDPFPPGIADEECAGVSGIDWSTLVAPRVSRAQDKLHAAVDQVLYLRMGDTNEKLRLLEAEWGAKIQFQDQKQRTAREEQTRMQLELDKVGEAGRWKEHEWRRSSKSRRRRS